ncbi:hypothetical protein ACLB2K_065780 [Fragaria x ananassa]
MSDSEMSFFFLFFKYNKQATDTIRTIWNWWRLGVEVKSGESVVVEPGTTLVHLSQACLDEVKKGNGSDSISLFVKIEPKVSLEEAKNEIKSDQKDSSSDDDDDDDDDDESEDEEFDQVKSVEDGSEDDDQSSDDDDDDDDDSDDEDDEDDDSEEEHEETPNKVEGSNKHAAESSKTPVQKKAKFVTPEKTGGKKGAVHTATPYPSKQAVKKPANSDQTKQQSSNSSGIGAFRCNPCNRSFNSDGALQNHTKAKHGAAK